MLQETRLQCMIMYNSIKTSAMHVIQVHFDHLIFILTLLHSLCKTAKYNINMQKLHI